MSTTNAVIELSSMNTPPLFKKTFDVAPFGMLVMDKNGVIQEVNQAFQKMLNRSKKEICDHYLHKWLPNFSKYVQLDWAKQVTTDKKNLTLSFKHGDSLNSKYVVAEVSIQFLSQEPCQLLLTILSFKSLTIAQKDIEKAGETSSLKIFGESNSKRANQVPPYNIQISQEGIEFELMLKRIIAALPNMVYLYDLSKDCYLFVNNSEKHFGYSAEAFNGENFFIDVLHPDDVRVAVDELNEAYFKVKDNEVIETEFRIKHGGGSWRWIKSRDIVFKRNNLGIPIQILGINHDITDLKGTQEALKAQKQFTEDIAQHIPYSLDIVEIVNSSYNIIYTNNLFKSYLSYEEHETINLEKDRYHPNDIHGISTTQRSLLKQSADQVLSVDYRVLDKHNKWRWIRSRSKIFKRDENKKPIQIMELTEDITDYKNRMNVLNGIIDNVVNGSPSHFFDHLVKHLVEALNLQCGFVARMTDSKCMEAIVFYEYGNLKSDVNIKLAYTPCDRLVKNKNYAYTVTKNLWKKFSNSEYITSRKLESYSGKILLDAAGNKIGILAVLGNSPLVNPELVESALAVFASRAAYELALQNKQMALEQQLSAIQAKNEDLNRYIASNLELERFAYIASHDLKAPLRTVISFSQLLERRYKNQLDQNAKDYINFIIQGTKNMDALISDLLNYSKVSNTEQPQTLTDLNRVVKKVLTNLHPLIQSSEASITLSELPSISAVPLHMKQLFQNLVVNALKFKKSDTLPVVKIHSQQLNTHWKITVEDNGIGMEKDYHEQIFVLFKRLHPKTKYKGTGIGLSICKKIVEQHGGKIWVNSEFGKGSSFHFTFPFSNA
ncbi:MAG: ATP-binding protein [Chitinophagales bacterium]